MQVGKSDYRVRLRGDLAKEFAKKVNRGCGVAVNGKLKREAWSLKGRLGRVKVVVEAESFRVTHDPVKRIGLVKTVLGGDRE